MEGFLLINRKQLRDHTHLPSGAALRGSWTEEQLRMRSSSVKWCLSPQLYSTCLSQHCSNGYHFSQVHSLSFSFMIQKMTKSAYVGWEQKPNSRFGSSQGLVAFPNWYCQEKEWNKKPQRSGGWGRRRIVMNSKLVWAPKWNSVSKTEGRKVGCLLAILNCLLNHLIDLLFYLKMPD